MLVLIDAEKTFDQIANLVTTVTKPGIEWNFLSLINGIYKKIYSQHHTQCERLNAFQTKIKKTRMSIHTTSIQYCTAGTSYCSKARKSTQIRKGEIQFSLFICDTSMQKVLNSQQKNPTGLISEFNKSYMKYKVKKPKIFKLKKLKNFFLLHHMACKDLSSPSRDQTQAHDSESPNHWTTRNFKQKSILSLYISSEQLETQNSIYVKI